MILVMRIYAFLIVIVYSDSKGSGESAHLQESPEPSFLDTAMIECAGSYDLFFVTSYNLFTGVI